MNQTVIIGIHGLANKPKRNKLKKWWNSSIEEGLRKNEKAKSAPFDFSMVYWADHLYKHPLHCDQNFHFDALFNNEPYIEAAPGALKRKDEGVFDSLVAAGLDLGGETVDLLKSKFGINYLADAVLGQLLKDLNLYYEDPGKKEALRDVLSEALLEHQGQKIMLVAHSMGSIIAYDVLTLLGQSHPNFKVDQFVTIGSPLGLPHVKGKIIEEFAHRGADKAGRVRTPSVVTGNWINLADRKDPVALDVKLADDYKPNRDGVRCVDDLVFNDYSIAKRGEKEPSHNHHKSYGYLRTPEFSELVSDFLA